MKPEALETFLSTATPYHFTITNECGDLANATINLESLNAGTGKQLQDEYIDAILYETDYHNNLNSQKQLDESMYNDENKVIANSLHAYKLYSFTLQKEETKSFNLLLYMDPDTPMETINMNATWKGKITLSTSYKEETIANLNGLKVPVVESGDGLYAVSHDVSEISEDWNKTEYRYAGSNPNNYVSYNNEIWRIIGLVNVKNSESVEQRLKIVRTDGVKEQKNIGDYYWDLTNNNWTTCTLREMLNGIYYESGIGDCYRGRSPKECNFSSGTDLPKGLNEISQNMIDKEVIWNLGSSDDGYFSTNKFYEKERGTISANDSQYPAEWSSTTDIGEKYNGIGLIYPSDYGYAVGGEVRNNCLTKDLYYYKENNCGVNDWLNHSDYLWTILSRTTGSGDVFYLNPSGYVDYTNTSGTRSVWPTIYLKSSVKITPNPHSEQEYGTIDNPFQLIDTSL